MSLTVFTFLQLISGKDAKPLQGSSTLGLPLILTCALPDLQNASTKTAP